MKLSPIILFAYNRPWHTKQVLDALAKNPEAKDSILYIYCDGSKENASNEMLQSIDEVRVIAKSENRFREIIVKEQINNKGLADSIVDGVTEVVNEYGKVIVLEDDVVSSSGFLKYMNQALNIYENEDRVMHISGYMYPHRSKLLKSTFFYPLPYPGGGWATWARAWHHYNNDAEYLYKFFEQNNKWADFNSDGGTFFKSQLKANINGTLKTWFVKWHASILINGGLTLFPNKTLIHNSGFDGSGVHCGVSDSYNWQVADEIIVKPIKIQKSKLGGKLIVQFYDTERHVGNVSQKNMTVLNSIKKIIPFKRVIRELGYRLLVKIEPNLLVLKNMHSTTTSTFLGNFVKLHEPYRLSDVIIGNYSYIAHNSTISQTRIGKFCSIGPNFFCGWGIHPTNGISTAPMFYSTLKQNGITLSEINKIEERKHIYIGNDVFIGMNVTVLDGVTIGDGAVIGAGAVVSKDIPPYAIAVGAPIKIIRYRFDEKQIEALLKIKWWNFPEEKLKEIEKHFFDVDEFIKENINA